MKRKANISHDEAVVRRLREHPELAVEYLKSLSENRLGEGDSPILLRGLRKIGTVPDSFRIGFKPSSPRWRRVGCCHW